MEFGILLMLVQESTFLKTVFALEHSYSPFDFFGTQNI